MPIDLLVFLFVIAIGALLQVGIGIGFSIVVGPLLFLQLGTETAVPMLLLLNFIVSLVAVPGSFQKSESRAVGLSAIACVVGIGAGISIYPYLSEATVLAIAGTLLAFGAMTTLLPKKSMGERVLLPVSSLSGLATVWAATPGPLMAVGLMLSGRSMSQVRRLVQPIALVGYGVALALHMTGGWGQITDNPNLTPFLLATLLGSLLGRWVGPKLPHVLISNGIRGMSLFAGIILLYRAVTLN